MDVPGATDLTSHASRFAYWTSDRLEGAGIKRNWTEEFENTALKICSTRLMWKSPLTTDTLVILLDSTIGRTRSAFWSVFLASCSRRTYWWATPNLHARSAAAVASVTVLSPLAQPEQISTALPEG